MAETTTLQPIHTDTWVKASWDKAKLAVIAFSVARGCNGSIETSQVLPGLNIALVESALRCSQTDDSGTITRWLLQSFGNS